MARNNSSELSAGANEMLVARDYAIMRLEYIYMLDDEQLSLCDDTEISSIAQSFHAAQVKVIASSSTSEHRDIFNHTATFDSKLREVKARMQKLVSPKVKASTASQPVLPKLPKINMKAFDGSLENWISFIQLFNSLVHNRTDLAPVEKLHYLLSSVHNVAYDLIKNYPVTNENYRVAYEALFRHFNKTRLIATTYYDKLIACEPVNSGRPSDLERVTRTFAENLAILKGFCLPDKNFMLVQLLWSKLDKNTKEQFELEHNSDDIPDFKVLQNFIEKRFRALDAAGFNGSNISVPHPKSNSTNKPKTALVVSIPPCTVCREGHGIISCPTFLSYDPSARFRCVKDNKLCILCLSGSHSVKQCKSKQSCQHCRFSHNTLLHFDKSNLEVPVAISLDNLETSSETSNPQAMVASNNTSSTLFSTARVLVRDVRNRLVPVKVVLDSASACSFVSEQCAKALGLPVKQGKYAVDGIGQAVAEPAGVISCVILPSTGELENTLSFEAFILPTICSEVPTEPIDFSSWRHTKDLHLADPHLNVPGPVDMLLSVDIFASSLRPGLVHGSPGQPTAINTIFGWVLMGGCSTDTSRSRFRRSSCHVVTRSFSLDDSTKGVRELKIVSSPTSPSDVILSKEDQLCEDNFIARTLRTEEGRSVVPSKDSSKETIFSGSRAIDLKTFSSSLEERLQSDFSHFRCRLPDNKLFSGPSTPLETKGAFTSLVSFARERTFCHEMEEDKFDSLNSRPNGQRKLGPFADDAGLLRVGGRSSNASIEKHPLLLPCDYRLTYILMCEYHSFRTLHGLLPQHFGVLFPKRVIQAVLLKCLKYFRVQPVGAPAPFVGYWPPYVVHKFIAFVYLVVDHGGFGSPLSLHHDHRLVSDRGKYFIGADSALQCLDGLAAAQYNQTKFEFGQPFSDLAKAEIRTVETHLSRVIGCRQLTCDGFSAVLIQVKAQLNLGPIILFGADPSDPSVLAPGRFSTTEPLSFAPDADSSDSWVSVVQRCGRHKRPVVNWCHLSI